MGLKKKVAYKPPHIKGQRTKPLIHPRGAEKSSDKILETIMINPHNNLHTEEYVSPQLTEHSLVKSSSRVRRKKELSYATISTQLNSETTSQQLDKTKGNKVRKVSLLS